MGEFPHVPGSGWSSVPDGDYPESLEYSAAPDGEGEPIMKRTDDEGVANNEELLSPVIVTEPDGTEWVQIVDEHGHFAGFDPSFDQIVQAVKATTTPENESHYYARIATLARVTVEKHDGLACRGALELAAEDFSGEDEMADFLKDPRSWREAFRRTQQVRQGEQ